MPVLPTRSVWLLAGLGLLAGESVAAQSVMPTASMPPPPSANDPLPRSTSEPARKKPTARAARPAGPDAETAAPGRTVRPAARPAQTPLADRIDTRPARQEQRSLQLEDDPRGGVAPIMQNGRPGVGMRF